jgi:3-dehydroquinate synthase
VGTDAPFSVDFVHRLRFTRGVLNPENPTLAEVLPAGGGRGVEGPCEALFFVDSGVAGAWPDTGGLITDFAERHHDRVVLAGDPVIVPGGEMAKNDRWVLEAVLRSIHDSSICRQSFVVVIGGGAVLDVVGFAASIAHRGVRLLRLPTTTLSQADSGLGVKNGVNAFGKKNFIGSFAAPWAVVNDLQFLETLGDDDFVGGFSEAVKVALIKDADLFHLIVRNAERIRGREPRIVEMVVRRSAELHLEHIVTGGDPFELSESRPLDFGHWSAHKLEQMTDFELAHGHAVAIGVALDTLYSAGIGLLSAPDAEAVLECLQRLGFRLYHPALEDTETVLEGLSEFREHLGGRLTVSMLSGIGRSVDVHEVDAEELRQAVRALETVEASAS